mgnify:CR=1 FL=1
MPPPLALTLGEPAGIGPDITFAAWRRRTELNLAPFYLLADPDFVARCAQRIAPDVPISVVEPAAAATSFASALPVVDGAKSAITRIQIASAPAITPNIAVGPNRSSTGTSTNGMAPVDSRLIPYAVPAAVARTDVGKIST